MSTLASLRILLGLDSGDVAKGAGRVRGELKGVQAEANRSRDALRGVAAGFGLGAGLGAFQLASRAVGEFTDFLGNAVKGAIEEEAGIARLGQALRANVADWNGSTAAIERTIEARTALGFKDDELRASFGSLVTATKDINAAFAIQSTAIDLARFKSISLEDATARLIKVNAGSFRALKDLGIELKAGASGMQALGEVQKRVAGQGEGFLDTTAGSLARAEAAVDKLSDAIGQRLTPAIAQGADALTDLLNKDLPSFAENSQREIDLLTGSVQDFLSFAGRVIGTNKDVALTADEVAAAANRAGDGIAAWTIREREGTVAAIALAAAVDTSKEALLEQVEKALESRDAAAELKKWMDFAGDSAAEMNNDLLTAANGMDGFTGSTNLAVDALARFAAAEKGHGIGVAERIAAAGDTGNETASAQFTLDQIEREQQAAEDRQRERDRVTADNRRRSDTAASDAKREADRRSADDARRRADEQADADRAAKDRAREYFDQLHDMNLKAIDDIRDRANEELTAQQKAIRGVVSAEQARVNAVRAREQENALRADVAGAGTPEDRAAALQDLNRFLEDQKIARMNSSADISIGLIDAEKARNDKIAADATAAENARAAAQRKAGVMPSVTATSPNATAGLGSASSFTATIVNQFFVDGEKIVDVVERRQAGLQSIYNPLPVSTGSQR